MWNNRLVQNRKEICQGCISSICLFNLSAEYIMRNTELDEAQAGIKIAGRNINYLIYADPMCFIVQMNKGAQRAGGSRSITEPGGVTGPFGLPEIGADPCSATG